MTVYAGESARVVSSLESDDNKALCPLPGTVTLQVKSTDEATEHIAEAAMTLIVEEKSTATAATAKTITDTTQAWKIDQWRDACVRITAGTGIGQERRIKSNTATMLTIDDKQVVNGLPVGVFNPVPDNTSQFDLHRSRYFRVVSIPSTLENVDVLCIVRATTTGGNGYKGAKKTPLRIEGKAV